MSDLIATFNRVFAKKDAVITTFYRDGAVRTELVMILGLIGRDGYFTVDTDDGLFTSIKHLALSRASAMLSYDPSDVVAVSHRLIALASV